jgi:hypothetical protein
MRSHGVRPGRAKVAAAWLAEKAGRLKLNGELMRYSPLSRLVELDGLAAGIEAKRAMWLALGEESHAQRAQSQRERLEPYRLQAAAAALRA